MPVNLRAVMAGVAARLETIPGLRVASYTPDQINPPAALISVPEVTDYTAAMRGATVLLDVTVAVLVSAANDRAGQLALADYADPAGPSSVAAAIWADRTLGGVVNDCHVTTFRSYGLTEVGQVAMYGGEFVIRVIASGR